MMLRILTLNKLGQTSIEYLLVLTVSITLGVTFYKKMDKYLISSPNSFIAKSLNQFKTTINSDPSGRYQRFNLVRFRR